MANSLTAGSVLVTNENHSYTSRKLSGGEVSERAKAFASKTSSYAELMKLITEKGVSLECCDGVERVKFRERYYGSDGVWSIDDHEIISWTEQDIDVSVFHIGVEGQTSHIHILKVDDGSTFFHFEGDKSPVSLAHDIIEIVDANSQFAHIKRRVIKREKAEIVEEIIDGHLDQVKIYIGDAPRIINRLPGPAILCADGVIRRNFESKIRGEWKVAGHMYAGKQEEKGPGPNDWVAWEIEDIGKHGRRTKNLVESVKPMHTHADRKNRNPVLLCGAQSEIKRKRLIEKSGEPISWAGGIVLDDEAPILSEEYSAFESSSAPPTPLNVLDLVEGSIGVRYLHTDGSINDDPKKRPFSVRRFPAALARNTWNIIIVPFLFVYEFLDERGYLDRWKNDEAVEEDEG